MEILKRTYILRGDKSPSKLRRVAREVDYHMSDIVEAMPNMDMTRTAVLAALNLAEEYLELQDRYDRVVRMLEEEYRKNREVEAEDEPVIPLRRDDRKSGEDAEGEEA